MTSIYHWLAMQARKIDWSAWGLAAALTVMVGVFAGIPAVML